MKLGTRTQIQPSMETVVIPRRLESGEIIDTIFKAKTVLDWEPFDQICPEPKVPMKIKAGSNPGDAGEPDLDNLDFKKAQLQYGRYRINWITIQSLSATSDLTWSTVVDTDPKTWANYLTELKEFGLAPVEVQKIIEAVYTANALTDKMLEEARARFLAGNAAGQSVR